MIRKDGNVTRPIIADFHIGGRYNVLVEVVTTIILIVAIGYAGIVAQDHGWIAPPDLTISGTP